MTTKHYSLETCTYDWCSSWFAGRVRLCDDCRQWNEQKYPQGWTGYPGDTCKHGTYVGGCGIDWTCARCEFSDEEE